MVASMKYGITIATIGDWPFIPITPEEFQRIRAPELGALFLCAQEGAVEKLLARCGVSL
jgi:hypothetical protein